MANSEPRESLTALDLAVSAEVRAMAAAILWTRADLERHTGLKRTRLRETIYEPSRSLRLSELDAICRVFGIAPVELLKGAMEYRWRPIAGTIDREPEVETVSPSRDDFDLVAKDPGREPDGDDEHFM